MPTLVLMPAYTLKEVSTASTVLILLLMQCLYCYAMSTLVFMPAYTVKEVSTALRLQCLYCFFNLVRMLLLFLQCIILLLFQQCTIVLLFLHCFKTYTVSTLPLLLLELHKIQDLSCFYIASTASATSSQQDKNPTSC